MFTSLKYGISWWKYMTKAEKNDDKISEVMNDPMRVRDIIQSGINAALLRHKQAGNPVCEWRDNKVVWIKPENIRVGRS
jgi:hypothetical protein